MSKPVADLWFGVQAVDGGLLHIRETHIDPYLAGNIWLVKGRDRALLIDSGTGLRPLRDTAAALAGVPVVARRSRAAARRPAARAARRAATSRRPRSRRRPGP